MSLQMLDEVPFDQVIALGCQGFSLLAAVIFYHFLHIKTSSVKARHAVSVSIGVAIVIVCYGKESLHLFAMSSIVYLFLLYLPSPVRGWTVLIACIGHVLAVHLHAYTYHYMQYRVEVSNSLMVMAIKLTCAAFSLDDSAKLDSQMTTQQLKHQLKFLPSFYEYFCFSFCFLGVLFGPAYHFNDYISFIKGAQYKSKWPARKALKMLLTSFMCLGLHYLLADRYPATYNLAPHVISSPLLYKHMVLWLTMLIARCKYYFCWLSSEAICLLCGMGYDPMEVGEKEWGNTIFTVNPWRIEFATSLKMFSDNWNVFTARWLHFCIYERVRRYGILIVFILSATWHGFYPGYLIMFMPLGLGIVLGRKLRRTVRPLFQTPFSHRLYDVITWFATVILISFNSCAFELREWHLIYTLQRSFYFWPHLVVAAGALGMPSRPSAIATRKSTHSNGFHK
ncbi:lysophospholipid acyltransferase 2-like [Watersipora subatra]|uniref:lysophospholipid acyltransferase 2-like n=1 Tax=Watersipora subatra TaxID=2589382 RepID=UPI00355B0604